MIEIVRGNLLTTDAEALVNTVNCVGVMGKGIALQFKKAYPKNYTAYRDACDAGEVKPGQMMVTPTGSMMNPKWIINFPTKRHWKGKSRIKDIESGLDALVEEIRFRNIKSVAVPPLGCGNGGLDWDEVRPLILSKLGPLTDTEIKLFEPGNVPAADTSPVRTKRPRLTKLKALVVLMLNRYAAPGYRISMLEIQKLAYFLDRSGEDTKLKFEKNKYGPYAEKLNFPIQAMDGHYLVGVGDRSKIRTQVTVVESAVGAAEKVLKEFPDSRKRLERVFELIDGFETPYGLELLSTVDWLANMERLPARSPEELVEAISRWSVRKSRMFKPDHINVAYDRLVTEAWLT